MEILIGIFFVGLLLFGPPVLYIRIVERRRRRSTEELRDQNAKLTRRIFDLEKNVKELQQRLATSAAVSPSPETTPATSPVIEPTTAPPATKPPVPLWPAPSPAPVAPPIPAQAPTPVTPSAVKSPPLAPPLAPHSAAMAQASMTTPNVLPARTPAPPRPTPPTTPPKPAIPKKKLSERFEEAVGTNWAPKLGVVLVFIGMVSYIASKWEHIPPAGRVGLFFLASFTMLGLGIFLEKREQYRMLGRSLIGGGWATTFFTTYAMYHVAGAKVISSLELDLVLMLLVAGTMVWHTLKYDSQFVTGCAFLLGFYSISQSNQSVFSLFAGVILALGLVVIVLRRHWYELEVFGIIASFFNHAWWLYPIIERMQAQYGHNVRFPEYPASMVVLSSYWAIFRASYVLRQVRTKAEESTSTVAALLNTFLLLGVAYYQSLHQKEVAFWALLILGMAELTLSLLPRIRSRREAFLVLATLGTCLMVGAIPVRFTDSPRTILWLIGAQAFLFAGIFGKEVVFRRFGVAIAMLVGVTTIVLQGIPYALDILNGSRTGFDAPLAILLASSAAVFYLNAHWVRYRWEELFDEPFERFGLATLSWMASLLIASLAWFRFQDSRTAVLWAGFALVLAAAGYLLKLREFWLQAHVLAAITVLRVLAVNLQSESVYRFGLSGRLVSVAVIGVLLYVISRFAQQHEFTTGDISPQEALRVSQIYTWTATLLLAVLAAYETQDWRAAVLWAGFALVLGVLGKKIGRTELGWQSLTLGVCAFGGALLVNMGETGMWYGWLSLRLASVLSVAAALYLLQLWPPNEQVKPAYSWAGSILISWLIWYQFAPVQVALMWAIFGLLLFEIGMVRNSTHLRVQGYFAFIAAFVRIFIANFNAEQVPGELSARVVTVLPLVPIFLYVYYRLQSGVDTNIARLRQLKVSTMMAYLGIITLAALVRFELQPDWVIVGWAALALCLTAAASILDRPVFLHQALLLLIPIGFRASMHNLYASTRDVLPVSQTVLLVSLTAGLLLVSLFFAFRLRDTASGGNALERLLHRPEQPLFFVPVALITALLWVKLPTVLLTLAWGVEAIAIFVFALIVGERSYRLTGLLLLVVCVGKILAFDVWNFNDVNARYLTLIGVGAILFVVSFLYGKYRDKVRELL